MKFLLLLLLFFWASSKSTLGVFQKPAAQNQGVSKVTTGLPVRLMIDAIKVDAAIQSVGINKTGEMAVPSKTSEVGWFAFGPRPGERGSAVIAGHLDGENGEPGVFSNLSKLKRGDKLAVEDSRGITRHFVVQEIRSYKPGPAQEVFNQQDSSHLNLITCEGDFDKTNNTYSQRLVVFADIVYSVSNSFIFASKSLN